MNKLIPIFLIFVLSIPVFGQDPILTIQQQLINDLIFYKETNKLLLEKIDVLEQGSEHYAELVSLLEQQNKQLLEVNKLLINKDRNNEEIIKAKDVQIKELTEQNRILISKVSRSKKVGTFATILSIITGIIIGSKI